VTGGAGGTGRREAGSGRRLPVATGARYSILDPLQRTLEVLRRQEAHWLIVGTWADDDRVRAEPFDAIELELGILWADVQL